MRRLFGILGIAASVFSLSQQAAAKDGDCEQTYLIPVSSAMISVNTAAYYNESWLGLRTISFLEFCSIEEVPPRLLEKLWEMIIAGGQAGGVVGLPVAYSHAGHSWGQPQTPKEELKRERW